LIAKAFFEKEKNARRLQDSTIKLKQMVNKVVKDLRLPNEDLGIPHIRRIEDYLKDYNIVCIDGGDRKWKLHLLQFFQVFLILPFLENLKTEPLLCQISHLKGSIYRPISNVSTDTCYLTSRYTGHIQPIMNRVSFEKEKRAVNGRRSTLEILY
jgi:hypothetical protein